METFKTTCDLYFKEPNFIKSCANETCDDSYAEKKSSIKTIIFQNEFATVNNAVVSVDLSEKEDGSILAYLIENVDDPEIYTAYIQSNETIYLPADSANFFNYFTETVNGNYSSELTSIEGLEYVDTSQVTNMHRMFYDLRYLSRLNLSHFDTSNVTNMSYMFANDAAVVNAPVLLELDLSSFDTSKVTSMSNMFSGQRNIVRLDVSSFDTSQVTNIGYMFYGLDVEKLDLSHFDTSNVTNMGGMFRDTSIQELNLSSFDTTKVTYFHQFFQGSNALTNVIYGEKFVYRNDANVSWKGIV